MKTQNFSAMDGQGLIIAFALVVSPTAQERSDEQNVPDEGERVENLPPNQPDVDPLKRENPEIDETGDNEPLERPDIDPLEAPNPDIDEIDENEPREQPDVDPLEAPNPDIDEINPGVEPEINELSTPEPNIDRDPVVEPGTDPMGIDHSQFI